MIASIPQIQSAHNFLTNVILIYYSPPQIFELLHTFEGFITYLYVVLLSCILISRHNRILSVLGIYF